MAKYYFPQITEKKSYPNPELEDYHKRLTPEANKAKRLSVLELVAGVGSLGVGVALTPEHDPIALALFTATGVASLYRSLYWWSTGVSKVIMKGILDKEYSLFERPTKAARLVNFLKNI